MPPRRGSATGTNDPFFEQLSEQIEGAVIIVEAAFFQFTTPVDVVRKPFQLPIGYFSYVQNMRPVRPGLQKRLGCIRLHTTADS